MDNEDKPKVVSLHLRRQQQLKEEGRTEKDPVMTLADEIAKLLGEQQAREVKSESPLVATQFAVNQLLSIELASRALLVMFEHTLGHVRLNEILVEVEHRRRHYKVEWPKHDQTKTYADHLPQEDASDAEVIPIRDDEPSDG
jgi:hypothetical protein